MRDNRATRLVLVTKWRDDAQFKLYSSRTGNGKISGLGFYVDPSRASQRETGESTNGFLGPFAYVSVTIVDVASMSVIHSVPARESSMSLPVDAKGAVSAWDALTPAGKVEALERVLRRAVPGRDRRRPCRLTRRPVPRQAAALATVARAPERR